MHGALEGSQLRVVELGSICQSVPGGDIPGMSLGKDPRESRALVVWLEQGPLKGHRAWGRQSLYGQAEGARGDLCQHSPLAFILI